MLIKLEWIGEMEMAAALDWVVDLLNSQFDEWIIFFILILMVGKYFNSEWRFGCDWMKWNWKKVKKKPKIWRREDSILDGINLFHSTNVDVLIILGGRKSFFPSLIKIFLNWRIAKKTSILYIKTLFIPLIPPFSVVRRSSGLTLLPQCRFGPIDTFVGHGPFPFFVLYFFGIDNSCLRYVGLNPGTRTIGLPPIEYLVHSFGHSSH